jgi:hypothetical protein
VPYQIKRGKEDAYHVAFQIALRALGFKINSEVSTEFGRADAVWELPEAIVIAELKYSSTGSPDAILEKALQQIRDQQYYAPYAHRPLKFLAVAFTNKAIKCRINPMNLK